MDFANTHTSQTTKPGCIETTQLIACERNNRANSEVMRVLENAIK
jgi:hypothetical protein